MRSSLFYVARRGLLGAEQHAAGFTLLAVALYFVGFSGLEAQFSTYATEGLGLTGGRAGVLLGVFSAAFVLFALPAGFLGKPLRQGAAHGHGASFAHLPLRAYARTDLSLP